MGVKMAGVKDGGRFLVCTWSFWALHSPVLSHLRTYFYFDIKSLVGNEIPHDVYVKSCSQSLTVLSQSG